MTDTIAGVKVSQCPETLTAEGADLLVVQGGLSKKISASALVATIRHEPETVFTLESGDLNSANGTIQIKTCSEDVVFTDSLLSGQSLTLHIFGGNAHVITWPDMTWTWGYVPEMTPADVIQIWKVGDVLYGSYIGGLGYGLDESLSEHGDRTITGLTPTTLSGVLMGDSGFCRQGVPGIDYEAAGAVTALRNEWLASGTPASHVFSSPSSTDGTLILDLTEKPFSYFLVLLTESLENEGITLVNIPNSGIIEIFVEFRQPESGGPFDIPSAAFMGLPGIVTFDTEWEVYQDDTPTRATIRSLDGGEQWHISANAELVAARMEYGTPASSAVSSPNGRVMFDDNFVYFFTPSGGNKRIALLSY